LQQRQRQRAVPLRLKPKRMTFLGPW
jgi:hypothetical protein